MYHLSDIRKRAEELMDELGRHYAGRPLQELGWSVGFDRAKRRLGMCKWKRKGKVVREISLSTHYAREGGWAIMEDVVRHEIAHALDYEIRGRSDHGPRWQLLARLVGADPTRLYEGRDLKAAPSKYLGVCPECGHEQPFYRRIKRAYACPECCKEHNGGRYAARFRLRIVERATGREMPAVRSDRKKYTACCPGCGRKKHFARKPQYEYACKSCCDKYAGGAYDDRFEWVVRQNY